MKREASFTETFRHWLRANPLPRITGAAFELKQTTGKSIPFSAVEEHQMDALSAVWGNEGLIYKISDESRGYKPFDMVYLRLTAAYIVVKFPGFFCLISASTWGSEKRTSQRKSLTAERAREIAEKVVELPRRKR